ncbi:hypothetical protein [Cellulomonas wangsupingiae]|uniref:DUF5648 domain-containing protein n=1 Tax=Cellulomonas wangsupingiae TaxID=2968085 RepID=A0ABY5K0G8_9CELL|nr:hypothetical protein [Cellulomonas wangsupingiae]MCC2335707.1 hypothetical protein [Cellulomonas wangsupingiae]MCM0640338.1 hypothetical protein [Cellulomonas wangsupingiae]UUI63942.1 hypothetical protein NP075_12455 [Cellulomonas wangsupingiae]
MNARTRWSGLTAVVGAVGAVAVLATGALGAGGAPTLTGKAAVVGTSAPATGARITTFTEWDDAAVDHMTTTVAADGTFSFTFPRATAYYLDLVEDATYRAGWGVVDAVPGATIECQVAVVPVAGTSTARSGFDCEHEALSTLVYRFWSPVFNNAHFFTTDPDEFDHLDTNDPNWRYEGIGFRGVEADGETCAVGTPVFRFYSPHFQSHFYTQSAAEKSHIVDNDRNWNYEGVSYCAYTEPVDGTAPLYRFWSPVFGKHFFTATQSEADYIRSTDRNWNYEGVAYHVLP